MNLQEAIVVFGGYALSALGFLLLALPKARGYRFRLTLSLACLATVLGLPYVYLFDLIFSDRFLLAALPGLVSLVLFSGYFYRSLRSRPIALGQLAFSVLLFLCGIWGNSITIYFANYCAFGACA